MFTDKCCQYTGCAVASGTALSAEHDVVRVATPKVPKQNTGFTVAWASAGPTVFHKGCWEALLATARSRKRSTLVAAEAALVKQVADTLETFEGRDTLRKKAAQVAAELFKARQGIAFTGAGVSVNAGIPDYRGTSGVDVLAALGRSDDYDRAASKKKRKAEAEVDPAVEASEMYLKLRPTSTHRLLARCVAEGKLAKVITQNCDDLHWRSGVPRAALIELHGNVFMEFCERCEREYRRPYCVDLFSTECKKEKWYRECPTCGWGHYTGRKCESAGCGGKLKDTIVNFGDDLHERVLGGLPAAIAACKAADVVLALGCSLTVTPANELPTLKPAGAKLVIVNLQATPFDADADIRVWGSLDDFFAMVDAQLSALASLSAPTAGSDAAASVPEVTPASTAATASAAAIPAAAAATDDDVAVQPAPSKRPAIVRRASSGEAEFNWVPPK